tara:strand:+ start:671 stop:916 length:246 start_codon:yes stop_codon:yes gene_type:complete
MAPNEKPTAINSAIPIVIPDGLVNPPIVILDFGPAVDVTGGLVWAVQVDLMGTHVENGYAYGTELVGKVLPKGRLASHRRS